MLAVNYFAHMLGFHYKGEAAWLSAALRCSFPPAVCHAFAVDLCGHSALLDVTGSCRTTACSSLTPRHGKHSLELFPETET